MNEHDGRVDSAIDHNKKLRWVVEITRNRQPVIQDCFVAVRIMESDPLLRTVRDKVKDIKNEKRIDFEFKNVEKGSDLSTKLESLEFRTHYEVKLRLHDGEGMPGKLTETWHLVGVRVVERTIIGQKDGLFTVELGIEYYQADRIPAPEAK